MLIKTVISLLMAQESIDALQNLFLKTGLGRDLKRDLEESLDFILPSVLTTIIFQYLQPNISFRPNDEPSSSLCLEIGEHVFVIGEKIR